MTNIHSTSSWHVGRVTGRCHSCNVELPPNTPCWAALCDRPLDQLSPAEKAAEKEKEKPEKPDPKSKKPDDKPEPSPFLRIDFCESCWAAGKRPGGGEPPLTMFSFWKTIVPVPEQKKKLLVDDSVLMDVFTRMEDKKEPQEIRFRFVLALILMRKRLLRYESTEQAPATTDPIPQTPDPSVKPPETWTMFARGESDKPIHVINPHLDATQIAEVSQQLSAILAEEV
ncbi:MAG: hypothetical protein ACTHN5_09980 [Phycisphaerae bacterium]